MVETVKCSCCGRKIPKSEEVLFDRDGEPVCEYCVDEHYFLCYECGELVPNDEGVEIDGEWYCEDCVSNCYHIVQCACCDEYIDKRRMDWYITADSDIICQACMDNDYGTCEDCGEIFYNEDLYWDSHDDAYYCRDCRDARNRKKLHDYGYKPNPIFKTTHDVFFNRYKGQELMFGVELEVDDGDDREDCAEDLADASDDIYCKTDGSLNHGIEIVTHPCTLQYHREMLGWPKLISIARDYDFSSHYTETCGLHVHVGVEQFGDEETKVKAKLVMLVNRHWDALVKFSRRKNSELEEWAKRPSFRYGYDEKMAVDEAIGTRGAGRYQAVNLKNSATVEFRLFKGTLRFDTILATLQLVNNICKYAMNHSIEDVMKSQWEDIAQYEQFPELREYLSLRGLTNVPELPPEKFEPRPELKVGARVRVIDTSDNRLDRARWMSWLTGTVAVIRDECIGVDFHSDGPEEFNNLLGTLPGRTGYWFDKNNLMLLSA